MDQTAFLAQEDSFSFNALQEALRARHASVNHSLAGNSVQELGRLVVSASHDRALFSSPTNTTDQRPGASASTYTAANVELRPTRRVDIERGLRPTQNDDGPGANVPADKANTYFSVSQTSAPRAKEKIRRKSTSIWRDVWAILVLTAVFRVLLGISLGGSIGGVVWGSFAGVIIFISGVVNLASLVKMVGDALRVNRDTAG